jgi:outer membrane lipoprotein SlyB
MRSLESKSRRQFLCVATLAFAATTFVRPAVAQYVYQPAPDYYHNDTASGTVVGGALGAITGAAVAGRKDRGAGALIGAGVGAITGNLMGRSKDAADNRRAAYGAATVGQLNQQAAAMAVTNYDLLQMTQAGLSEDVIISTMRSRGARIDLSPQALIALKQQGVSDRVVVAAQQMSAAPGYIPPAAAGPTVISEVPPPPAVIVAPAYRPYYYHPPYYHHHHYHRGPRTYVGIRF